MSISEHPTWHIYDSSKIDEFIRCNRMFFFRYVLGWDLETPAQDLHFGEAWHRAREHQLINGYDDIEGAYSAFLTCYREKFPPEQDEWYSPKTPTAVLNALMKFADERRSDLVENEVVILDGKKMTEISGRVPISNNRFLHYRMDSIMRNLESGKIFSWDHKTTTEGYINGPKWADQFFLSIQNGTYTHCLYCMFPIEQVLGVEFCGTGFTYLKRGSANRPAGYHVTLRRVPAYKTPDQMNAWLWTANNYVDDIEREMDRLTHCKESDPVMMSFPMNPTSCTDFRGCPYHDFCLSWQNPLQRCYEPPLGFTERFWNPEDMTTTNKKNLEWRGR